MSWIQLAAELLKEPAFLVFLFAVIIGCLLLCLCRNAISSLLSRTRTIGTQGLSADPYSVLEKQPEKIETNMEAVQELLNQVGNSGLITQTEQSIHADLQKRKISDDADKVTVLVKHLAGTQTALFFESIYGSIFGSQISLLEHLNQFREPGMDTNAVKQYFEQVKAAHPALQQWQVAQYLQFLLERSLIRCDDDTYRITTWGGEFLVWMAHNGRGKALRSL